MFLNIFGLDSRSESGEIVEGGDGKLDLNGNLFNLEYGEIIFPFHYPFAFDSQPFVSDYDSPPRYDRFWGNPHPDLDDIFQADLGGLQQDESLNYQNYTQGPAMYFNNTSNSTPMTSEFKFKLQIQHSSQSSTISLGFIFSNIHLSASSDPSATIIKFIKLFLNGLIPPLQTIKTSILWRVATFIISSLTGHASAST